jgi:hypothetical protein
VPAFPFCVGFYMTMLLIIITVTTFTVIGARALFGAGKAPRTTAEQWKDLIPPREAENQKTR